MLSGLSILIVLSGLSKLIVLSGLIIRCQHRHSVISVLCRLSKLQKPRKLTGC
jgi:hypothetical protein